MGAEGVGAGQSGGGRVSDRKGEDLHVPVLLDQVLSVFEGRGMKVFVDGTLGMAGHTCHIYEQNKDTIERVVGIDQDPVALGKAAERLRERGCERQTLLRGNFGDMKRLLGGEGIMPGSVDGILLDIGVSSLQLDDSERGFSFMRDGPLDMRMDPSGPLTAADIVNLWSEEEIARVIYEFGEEPKSRSIARKICAVAPPSPL